MQLREIVVYDKEITQRYVIAREPATVAISCCNLATCKNPQDMGLLMLFYRF